MPEYTMDEFAEINSNFVEQLPEWKKRYDLRVSSYNMPRDSEDTDELEENLPQADNESTG